MKASKWFNKVTMGLVLGFATHFSAVNAQTLNWSYSGQNVSASGQLVTSDAANAEGYYSITSITGQRNGIDITGLYTTGEAIPGNEGFPVDNLISTTNGSYLSENGLGYSLSNGDYVNPFFADWLATPSVTEVLTSNGNFYETPVSFTISQVAAVPEPETYALLAIGLVGLAMRKKHFKVQKLVATN